MYWQWSNIRKFIVLLWQYKALLFTDPFSIIALGDIALSSPLYPVRAFSKGEITMPPEPQKQETKPSAHDETHGAFTRYPTDREYLDECRKSAGMDTIQEISASRPTQIEQTPKKEYHYKRFGD